MVCIVVEGKDDKHFLEYVLKNILILTNIPNIMYKIEISNGCTQLKEELIDNINICIADDIPVYIIYDMDNKDKSTRQNEIIQLYANNGISINTTNIFLLPNNNNTGYLETLIFSCVPSDRQFILTEYDNFIKNIQIANTNKLPLYLPDHHKRLFVYADIQLNDNSPKDKGIKKRCQYAPEKQGLYDFTTQDMQPLLDFLKTHVK